MNKRERERNQLDNELNILEDIERCQKDLLERLEMYIAFHKDKITIFNKIKK